MANHLDTNLTRTESRGTHREDHVHLVPEPSADPADPLNWAMWRKLSILFLMGIYAILGNTQSSILASALPDMVYAFAKYHADGPPTGLVPFSDLSHLIAVNSLMLGASAILWVPLSHSKSITTATAPQKFNTATAIGRRPIILLNLLVLCVASVWCGKAKSFNSLLAGRLIQGMSKPLQKVNIRQC